jgi:hypothetical protein
MHTRHGPLIGFLLASFLCLTLPGQAFAHTLDDRPLDVAIAYAVDDPGAVLVVIVPSSCVEHAREMGLPVHRVSSLGDLLDALVPPTSPMPVFVDAHRERAARREDALALAVLEPAAQRRTHRRPVGLPLPNH